MSFITSPGIIVPPLTAGGVAYGTGGQAKVTSAGTAGQALLSAGAGVPIWGDAAGSVVPPFTAGSVAYGTGTDVMLNAAGTTGQVLTSAGAGVPTWATAAAGGLTLGTPVNTTSGTAVTFTGIPAGVKMIVVNLAGVSLSGTSLLTVQLGDSGGIETTGYVGRSFSIDQVLTATAYNFTNGFDEASGSAAFVRRGMMILVLQNSSTNNWVASGHWTTGNSGCTSHHVGGYKPLSSVLTQVRVTSDLPDTFTAGAINIAYM